MARARSFNLTAEINLRGPANIRTVVADIRRQLGTINVSINPQINANAQRNITNLNRSLTTLNTTLNNTTRSANNAAQAINNFNNAMTNAATNNFNRNLNNAATNANNLGNAVNNTNRQINNAATGMEEFGRQSALAIRRFAAFSVVTSAIYSFTGAVSKGVKAFIDFDKEFVRLQQVTGQSAKGLRGLSGEITNLATTLGVASSDLTTVAVTLAQAGLSARETEKALKALALSSLAPSFDDMNQTVEGSIALMRQFNISADQLESALGSVNAVAAAFAVEASDLITAIQRTGGVFATASKGVSEGTDALNEFLAVFTSIRATTRESAETIATGLRTIFARIQRKDTIDALRQYGVMLTDLEGKFVGPYEAVKRLSEGLSKLDPRDLKFSQIVEELGGFRQIGKVIPLIQQFTVAQRALGVAQKGSSSLTSDAATAQLSLANQIAKVREEFTALIRKVGESDSFRTMVKMALDLASALIKLADAITPVLPALTAMAAFKGVRMATQFGRGFRGGLGFATGGLVPGTGNSDTVSARLTPGEYVIRKKAVQTIGADRLAALNSGSVQKFAAGTMVKPPKKAMGVGGIGIFDSDKIPGGTNIKKALLDQIKASRKPYSVISGPAGSGKTTFATTKFGSNFILNPQDISKYSRFVVLSGAGKTKSGDFSEPVILQYWHQVLKD
jgi:TP901 family phage tail tape measure protein